MKYIIKDADGNVTNYITADAEFVEANFEHYELWVEPTPVEPTAEEEARQWRDDQLAFTDWIIPLTDHPQREAHITYRESLRQWPSTESFPETKPEL
jgi:hypothetical protein